MRGRRQEVIGLFSLGLGVFIALCLVSFDDFDPSFHSLAPGREIGNLGGVIGSYLADLLLTLFGKASYLIPAGCVGLAARGFLQGLPGPWRRQLGAAVSALVLVSVFFHLHLSPIGVRAIGGGGLVGLALAGLLTRTLGLTGTYIVAFTGLSIAFVTLTGISFNRLGLLVRDLARLGYGRAAALAVIAWGRGRKRMEGWVRRFQAWRKERERPSMAPVIKAVSPKASPPEKTIDVVMDRAAPGPKILPRVDLKDKKREQLDLISPLPKSDYQLPSLTFLESESQQTVKIDEEALKLNSKLLEKKLLDYGVEGKITEIHPGPIITMYEFEPASGVKVNKIVNLEDDLALTMGGKSVRIIAPLPGKAAVGIEIPNNNRETVWLKEVVGHAKFQKSESKLTLALGKDTEGIPFVADLARMPHLLVAGATGSGKSVSVNSMILSLLYKGTPEDVRLIMVDLKMLELSVYEGIPHLLLPVVTHPRRAAVALHWAVKEMERRYEVLAERAARNITSYNKQAEPSARLPFIVIVIDELADLMMTTSHEVERLITRLAQMARAAGIHLILATQRPSVDVLTGLIKANFPARISFKVSSKHDSRTIIDTVGSEHLLGFGDMLFLSAGTSRLTRIHGAYVSEEEILRVVEHCRKQGTPAYLEEGALKALEVRETEGGGWEGVEEGLSDDLYDQAVGLVAETRQASISMVQRRLRIGYNRAARLIERMEREGVVGPADGAKPREVFVNPLGNAGS